MDCKISGIKAIEILDSRGNPTIKVCVKTKDACADSMVPSGASTGIHEALELRDDDKSRYGGKGVLKAVDNVNNYISKNLIGMDCTRQDDIDKLLIGLDGTPNKSKLGANAMLGVSMAVCKAGAKCSGKKLYEHIRSISDFSGNGKGFVLPIPQMNLINSGKHAGVDYDIQEHMIMPVGFSSFREAMRAVVEVYHNLKNILKKKYGAKAILLGDEGGFAPPIESVEERLELLVRAIKESGYEGRIKLALDCAASEFYDEGKGDYCISGKKFDKDGLVEFYSELASKFPIISIEDGFAQDDWKGWSAFNGKLGRKMQVVGDDLLVTNIERIRKAVEEKACNSLLLKVNQIGTVSESIEAARLSLKSGWKVVVSHRSGETEDSFIADLCVGLGTGQSKFGAPARSERTAKYNRLLEIEEKLGEDSSYAKWG